MPPALRLGALTARRRPEVRTSTPPKPSPPDSPRSIQRGPGGRVGKELGVPGGASTPPAWATQWLRTECLSTCGTACSVCTHSCPESTTHYNKHSTRKPTGHLYLAAHLPSFFFLFSTEALALRPESRWSYLSSNIGSRLLGSGTTLGISDPDRGSHPQRCSRNSQRRSSSGATRPPSGLPELAPLDGLHTCAAQNSPAATPLRPAAPAACMTWLPSPAGATRPLSGLP